MIVLLDTHAFIWSLSGDERLSKAAREAFMDTENRLFISVVSYWEICIKISLGKLHLSKNWEKSINAEMKNNSINWLPIESKHCTQLVTLPFHHRDPFDRMIICQAMVEKSSLISGDRQFNQYNIDVVW